VYTGALAGTTGSWSLWPGEPPLPVCQEPRGRGVLFLQEIASRGGGEPEGEGAAGLGRIRDGFHQTAITLEKERDSGFLRPERVPAGGEEESERIDGSQEENRQVGCESEEGGRAADRDQTGDAAGL